MADELSPWISLGNPGLALGRWFRCPQISYTPRALLRISFTFLEDKFDGYVLVRNLLEFNGLPYVCEAAQVYPDERYTLIELPYPQALLDRNVSERYVQARPRAYNRRYGAGFSPVELEMLVEELL